jgi:hypothetical protein
MRGAADTAEPAVEQDVPTGSTVACNLCGRDDYTVVYEAGIAQLARIVRCNGCGLMYANPRAKAPDVDQIVQWNPDFNALALPWMRVRYDKERLQVRDYRNSRREMARAFPNEGKLLEIGASFGYGLQTWRDAGWDVTGVEPWGFGAKYDKEKMGLTVHPDPLERRVR